MNFVDIALICANSGKIKTPALDMSARLQDFAEENAKYTLDVNGRVHGSVYQFGATMTDASIRRKINGVDRFRHVSGQIYMAGVPQALWAYGEFRNGLIEGTQMIAKNNYLTINVFSAGKLVEKKKFKFHDGDYLRLCN